MAGALIGALRVSLSAETSAFEQGMKRAQKSANTTAGYIRGRFGGLGVSLKESLAGLVGAITIGTILTAGKAALDYAGHLGELADTLGLTTKDLQEFSYAAGQVGVSQEELQTGIQKLTISIGQAELGAKKQINAFNAIGISVDQLRGKNAGEVFRIIADKLQTVTDRSQRAAVEVALFGKAGAKLDNLLSGAQGKLSDLADAAQRLGIVLSDEQIQKADETADKLEALETVLKARLAGVVADNANAILGMADALGELAGELVSALGELARFASGVERYGQPIKDFFANISNPKNSIPSRIGQALGIYNPGSSLTVKLPPAKRIGGGPITPTKIAPFLAPEHHAKKAREDHTAEQQLRDEKQFADELSRARQDVLSATIDLSHNADQRAELSLRQLDMERDDQERELQYQQALFKLTKGKEGLSDAQARQLESEYVKADLLKRQQILEERETQKQQDAADLRDNNYDLQLEQLQLESDLKETAAERRAAELRILEVMEDQEKARLEAVLADQTSSDLAKQEAQARLNSLDSIYAGRRQSVIQQTRGPLEDYLASLPTTAAKANEALQQLEAQGMDGFLDSILALSDGLGSATDSLLQTLKQFLLGLARLELQKLLGGALQGGGGGFGGILGSIGSLFGGGTNYSSQFNADVSGISFGGLPGFAMGGSGIFRGLPGRDRNIVSINGIPQFRVSYGERWNIGNDNASGTRSMGRGGNVYMTVNTPDGDSFRKSDGQITRSLKRRLA